MDEFARSWLMAQLGPDADAADLERRFFRLRSVRAVALEDSITTGLPFSSRPSVSIRPRCHGPVGYSDARNRMPSICSRPASTRRCSSTSSATVEPDSSASRPSASRRNNISSATSATSP
ncbi:hypothetical protein ACWCOY_36040 [Streptomyces tubercidicus]